MIISVCYCVCSQFALLVESGAPPQFWSLCGNFQKKRKRKKSHRFMSIIYICKNRERKKRTPITNKSQKTNSFFFFFILYLLQRVFFFFVCCCQWRGLLEIHLVALPCYILNTVYFIIFKFRPPSLKPVLRSFFNVCFL